MEWTTANPIREGKYVVETKTAMGRIQRLESYWNGKSWSFTNQVFLRYLKEG
jgi:hypothetical protein